MERFLMADAACVAIGAFLNVVLWACPAGAQVSPLPANSFMASPAASTGNLSPRTIVSSDLFQGGSCTSGLFFYNNGGSIGCTAAGTGSVTSTSWTGGIVSIATPTTTPAFTVAGTAGGIVYFPTASTWASTASGTAIQLLHGGAGTPSFSAITSADVTAVLASPPPIGSTVANTGAFTTLSATGLATFTGSIAHNPTTAEASGVVPGIYQTYVATGSTGTALSATINALNLTSDNLTVAGAPGAATMSLFSVYDLAFGGAAAQGGRIAGDFDITQTAATSVSNIAGSRFYIGLHGTANSQSGDGGGAGTEKGSYFGAWSSAILGASATRVSAEESMEMDITALSGSSVLNKAILQLTHTSYGGGADVVHGSVVDADLWIMNTTSDAANQGSNDGILFGRADGAGGLGVNSTGTLIRAATEVATIGNGIDLTGGGSLTITTNAWASPGVSITGSGLVNSTGTMTAGFQCGGTKSTACFYDFSTTPVGLYLVGTYSNVSLYMNAQPDFHYAGTTTCSVTGSFAVKINGVAHAIPYC